MSWLNDSLLFYSSSVKSKERDGTTGSALLKNNLKRYFNHSAFLIIVLGAPTIHQQLSYPQEVERWQASDAITWQRGLPMIR